MNIYSMLTLRDADPVNVSVKRTSLPAISLGFILMSLSACGGGTAAKQMPGTDAGLTQAAGTDSPVNVSTPDSTGGTGDKIQPAPLEVPEVPEVVDTGADNQQPAAIDNSVNQELIGAAGTVGCEADPTTFQDTMLEMINASRSEVRMCGDMQRPAVGGLLWNSALTQAAVAHANDMTTHNFFSHDGSDGLSVSQRADTAGYPWRAVGENIAAGQLDIAEVHQGWLDSAGHCVNIMNKLFTEVGAACIRNPQTDFGTYWVVVFGDSK